MPYAWQDTAPEQSGAVSFRLELWPHRSLSRRGFVWVIALTASAMALPLLALLGRPALWEILPFALLPVWALWLAIRLSNRRPHERLDLARDSLTLTRSDPRRPQRIWRTNPYWVRAALRDDGPVENYLVLSDGRREIELGAFLSPAERRSLHGELATRLAALRG